MSDRIPCSVPFFRRTAAREKIAPATEITKATYRKLRRLVRRANARGKAMPALWRRTNANWLACKAEAIERAEGIA